MAGRVVSGSSARRQHWLDAILYPRHHDHWDDEIFRHEILAVLRPEQVVLDLGSGRGVVAAMNFRRRVRRVIGIDVDMAISQNAFLDAACMGDAAKLPFPGQTFDVVFSDNVLEHLEAPDLVFREVARVLKTGGRFFVKTPNRWHYVTVMARMTSLRVHAWFNQRRGRDRDDTFPTLYRANTARDLRALARQSGLILEMVRLIEGRPEYLRWSTPSYVGGWLYERMVNSHELFAQFRVILVGVFRKVGEGVGTG